MAIDSIGVAAASMYHAAEIIMSKLNLILRLLVVAESVEFTNSGTLLMLDSSFYINCITFSHENAFD